MSAAPVRVPSGAAARGAERTTTRGALTHASPTPAPSPLVPARRLPFDEYAVWTENADYVRRALDLPATGAVHVYRTSDPALAPGSDSLQALDPLGRAKDVTPMDADVYPFVATTA